MMEIHNNPSKFKKNKDAFINGNGQMKISHTKNRSNINVISKVLSNDSNDRNHNYKAHHKHSGTIFDNTAID